MFKLLISSIVGSMESPYSTSLEVFLSSNTIRVEESEGNWEKDQPPENHIRWTKLLAHIGNDIKYQIPTQSHSLEAEVFSAEPIRRLAII